MFLNCQYIEDIRRYTPYKIKRRYIHVYDSITMSVFHLGNSKLMQKDNNYMQRAYVNLQNKKGIHNHIQCAE